MLTWTRTLTLFAGLFLGLVGCSGPAPPNLSVDDALRIVTSVSELEVNTPLAEFHCLKRSEWPVPIQELKPESVCKIVSGIEIQIWSEFVASKGFIVTEEPFSLESQRPDASYKMLHESLYWYHIRG